MAFLREQRMGWFPVEARVAEQMPQPPALEEEIAAWNNNPWNVRNDANNLNDTRRAHRVHSGRWQDRAQFAEKLGAGEWQRGLGAADKHEGRWQQRANDEYYGQSAAPKQSTRGSGGSEERAVHSRDESMSGGGSNGGLRSESGSGSDVPVKPRAGEGGLHDGRWQDRANWAERKPPHMWCEGDRHEGRWQEQARVGDGGKGTDGVFDAAAALDDEKRRIHSGRWQARANFDDLTEDRRAGKNVRPPHNGKERRAYWEAGGFQKGACGMHEGRWEDGVWVSGLWEGRAQWAHEDRGRGNTFRPKAVIREGSHELEPQWQHGRRPIGPELEDKRNAGGWEARGQVPYENEHPKPEKDRNFGRWEARAEWAEADTVVQRHREAPELHRGRWEERAFRDQPCTPQERAARKAAEARARRAGGSQSGSAAPATNSAAVSRVKVGTTPVTNLNNRFLAFSPSPIGDARHVELPAHYAARVAAAAKAARPGGRGEADSWEETGGAFSKWMEKGDKQWTRTPEEFQGLVCFEDYWGKVPNDIQACVQYDPIKRPDG
ncbi:hypothetical protein CYMTET_9294 [Cymbomonas tetramitiformis]|uniref:Uncharacterized protein n=1 Tax=Cymbomonas tetramitiformis TaxID=36881 RepID=A0AAE0LFL9_9CHLO|nr:hypothetical protein CYMTET_9294 [Cymbomonas tetramitiformis]